MRPGALVPVALVAAILRPVTTAAQQNVVALGGWAPDNSTQVAHLGRDLLDAHRRLGLRMSVDYERGNASRQGFVFFPSDTGPFLTRPAMYSSGYRSAGIWLAATFTPIRWRLEPYAIASVGIQDRYSFFKMDALDSATIQGVSWPSQPALADDFGVVQEAVRTGAGLRWRIGRVQLFGEMHYSGLPNIKRLWDTQRGQLLLAGLRF